VDELNAVLGIARSHAADDAMDALLAEIQNRLFDLGAELATPDAAARQMPRIGGAPIAALEQAIDRHEASLPPLTNFVLPAGTPLAAQLHHARTVCRRAERRVVTLSRIAGETVSAEAVIYLNRLSDLLFVLARA